ncbi:HipA family kinase [Paenibacillus larvae]|uniref:HipA-like kinase domain-containing protein n=2 Tax=Paenibacillus larvae TaxID=1464 RepID=A0A2L1U3S0_9BACL|nr:HipA family kinase [Paenibacillus larvae]AQZ45541.1 hypothetical protein B5S25_01955 [Paenibacillus larvae subsp. pulvifaciens]AVF27528.1 hypothetical protein ERICIII_03418 [Paenibacillus larvae subsp. larvae]MBH0342781.1 hypothetical protein [Paenibacillus larvae]MBH0342790.1 hypothetical protein [Paenibacillus larvae]MCY7522130.1 phosphatidylinositol 4-kinase [Paenibacillus larvae]
MTKRIRVSTFLKKLGEGISEPLIVLGDDNERYILKNQKVESKEGFVEFNCMFLNEILSSRIANYLDVPVPKFAIAELDKRILENGPALRFFHRFTEGTHYASKEIANTESNLRENFKMLKDMGKPYISRTWNRFYESIVNKEDIAKIIAFDLLIANFDRYNNTGNLLVAKTENGRKLFSIDHGHAFFGPVWNTDKIGSLKSAGISKEYLDLFINSFLMIYPNKGYMGGLGEVFRAIENNIDLENCLNHSFQLVVHKIESIQESIVNDWFNDIPDIWFVDKISQSGFYKHFLLNQKSLVRWLIQAMADRGAFSNYRGGNLQWIEKIAGTV